MEIKWFGTATIGVSDGSNSFVFDPYEPMNKDLNKFSLEEIRDIDVISITHGHFDHLKGAIEILKNKTKKVYCSRTAMEKLIEHGVNKDQISIITSGSLFSVGEINVKVFKGKHIRFNLIKIIKSLFNKRVLVYKDNLKIISKENKKFPAGDVLVFEIKHRGKKLLHFGSLNIDKKEIYPKKVDIISIPYQGRSDMSRYLIKFLREFSAQTIYIQHFDDAFPPVSVQENIEKLITTVKKAYPHIDIIVPTYNEVTNF